MNTFADSVKALKVWFDKKSMWVALDDGRVLAVPRKWFPRLDAASNEQLENYEFSGNGIGVHWDDLDEDIFIPNLLVNERVTNVYK